MKERKIVQVALVQDTDRWNGRIYAVADDGSLWACEHWTMHRWSEWQPLPSLPPREDENEKEDHGL